MNTLDQITETDADAQAVMDFAMHRKPIPPECYQRIKERGRQLTEAIRQEFGVRDIAADLVRESREGRE